MYRVIVFFVALVTSATLHAFEFNRIVTLGDSLQDDPSGQRSPLAGEQLAARLDLPITQLAQGGATSASLIEQGQHTAAAEQFGEGDLALVWIGGNDFLDNANFVVFGDYSFLDTLEANTEIILETLLDAEIEVVVYNLPDMSQVPGVIENLFDTTNMREASRIWRDRLNELGSRLGVTVVDMFTAFERLGEDPEVFAIDGELPQLGPVYGPVDECIRCVWFDPIHPTSLGQGFIANTLFLTLNAAFDVTYSTPIPAMSQSELASLASSLTYINAAGLWYDPAFDGEGYNLLGTEFGTLVYFYGYGADGQRLWLISELNSSRIALDTPLTLEMSVGQEGGNFSAPVPPDQLQIWGELTLTFSDCDMGTFELDGLDGVKTHEVQKLVGIEGNSCTGP